MPKAYLPHLMTNFTPTFRTVDPPVVTSVTQDPVICLVMSENLRQYVLGALEAYCYADRYNGSEIEKNAAAALLRDLQAHIAEAGICENSGGEMYRLRERPGDRCQIEQSWDGGSTWHEAWRTDRCAPGDIRAYLGIISGDVYNSEVVNNYDGTYESVINNYPPDYGPPGSITDKVLCYALERYVASCAEVAKALHDEAISEQQEAGTLGALILGLIVGIVTAPFTGGTSLAAYAWHIGFSIAVLQTGVELLDEVRAVDRATWDDADALQKVRCEMYNALRGSGSLPELADWKTSVSGLDFDSDPEKIIARWVYECNQSQDSYLGFLTMLDDLNNIADRIPETDFPSCSCQCDADAAWDWEYDISSTEDRLNDAVAAGVLTITRGQIDYVSVPVGLGWHIKGLENGTNNYEAEITVNIPAQVVGTIGRVYLGLWLDVGAGCGVRYTEVELDASQGRVFETTLASDISDLSQPVQLEIAAYLTLTTLHILARGSCKPSRIHRLHFYGCDDNIFTEIGLT